MNFSGLAAPPTRCPKGTCGALVRVVYPTDPRAPGTWSCTVGHGGVINSRPVTEPELGPVAPGMCIRCRVNPAATERRMKGKRNGSPSKFCDECFAEGRKAYTKEER